MVGLGSTLERAVAGWMFWGCVLGGVLFIVMGARAAGLALLGAVVAGIVVLFANSDLDRLAHDAVVGATIGAFVGGVAGLAWRSSASAVTLGVLGSVTMLVGVVSVLAGWAVTHRPCGVRVAPCLFPEAEPMGLVWFAIDGAWIAALCFTQAAQSHRSQLREEPTQTDLSMVNETEQQLRG